MTTITITGDVVERMVTNVGDDLLIEWKAPADKITSGDVIDITGSAYVNSGDTLKIVSATNVTDGNSILNYETGSAGTMNTITYNKTTRKFTLYGTANSSDEIRIEGRLVQ